MQRASVYAASLLVLAFATAAEERQETQIATLQLGFLYERHFGADREVLLEQARWVSESDLLVALHLRRLTHTDLEQLVGARRAGASWDEIARQNGLRATAFHVQLPDVVPLRGPYVRPYSAWREQPGADLQLTDEEVRELVLLRTLRDFCHLSAAEVVRERLAGRSPQAIAGAHAPAREGVRSSLQPGTSHRPDARKP